MERIKTFQIAAVEGELAAALEAKTAPRHLAEPLEAIAARIIARSEVRSTSVYICSADGERDTRNFLAGLLAKTLTKTLPDTLLVDCDFVSVGLSGIVPQYDALGFLDLLLYGSSLGVIRQTTRHGIGVIGAGSFPVVKSSPFVMDAFEGTRRYLATHSRCVIYLGPALDEAGEVHALVEQVDLPIVVREGRRVRPTQLDILEEKLVHTSQSFWSVRLIGKAATPAKVSDDGEAVADSGAAARAAESTAASQEVDEELLAEAPTAEDSRGARAAAPEPQATVPPEPREEPASAGDEVPVIVERKSGSSIFPIVLTSIVAIALAAFLFWWLYLTRSFRDREAGPEQDAPVATVPAGDVPTVAAADSLAEAHGDTTAQPPVEEEVAAETSVPPQVVADSQPPEAAPAQAAADTDAADDGGVAVDETGGEIIVTDDLARFAGQYAIHISSFRRLELAREDAYYLSDRGYPIIIATVDLAEKGRWFRVYVGPYDTSELARSNKIKLDGLRRIQSTRMTKITG